MRCRGPRALGSRALFETGQAEFAQIRIVRDGTALQLRIESRLDATGENVLMALVDVTEQERARTALEQMRAELEHRVAERTARLTRLNEALAESEARFRLLADNARDVVFRYRLKPSPAFDYVSPSIGELTGHGAEEFQADPGLVIRLVIEPDQRRVLRLLSGDVSADELEFRFRDRQDNERWGELKISGVRDVGGELVALEGIARETTERKLAELALQRANDDLEGRVAERTERLAQANEALVAEVARRRGVEHDLRERELSLASIVATAVDGIIRIDGRGLIEALNPAAEGIFGLRARDTVGKSVQMLLAEPLEAADADSLLRTAGTARCR